MGQYRLWLHYREVDRQLHSELELLEEKLAALQEQASRLQATAPTDNIIIQALQGFLRTETETAPTPETLSGRQVTPLPARTWPSRRRGLFHARSLPGAICRNSTLRPYLRSTPALPRRYRQITEQGPTFCRHIWRQSWPGAISRA